MTTPGGFDFSHLSPEQRLDLIGQLWDSLEADHLPVHTWDEVRDTVLRRSEEIHAGRAVTAPWEQVRARLFRKP